jgi:cytochrome c2
MARNLSARLCLVFSVVVLLSSCGREHEPGLEGAIGAEVAVGRRLIDALGCGSCHVIPGASGANGAIGPSLEGFGARSYIAGSLVNTQGNLMRWIIAPQKIHPGTAMPDLGASEEQAHAMAVYLGTLR